MSKFFSKEAFAVMHIRNFRLFLAYRFFMTSATLMQAVIVGWQLYDITKNPLSLGMIGLTEVIPQVSIALFAGHFVDIWDRKKIMSRTSLILLIGSGILLFSSINPDGIHFLSRTTPIFITIFLVGLTRGILMPAHTALMGQLVPRELLTGAATWGSTAWADCRCYWSGAGWFDVWFLWDCSGLYARIFILPDLCCCSGFY